ncbi:UDP-4-amino-4,6-dideoxy-N-acetyl-beta-L-altrosamine transaminase [Prosthecobacter fusiformis]|uniref:UDP-4-amino-4, 6-dideoxy-N-acetyl-beta-L-altrosamine transaminase n=1 Tax=Prosthecobacter fusiformis TaxID=48464 RepID=A0A4V3FFG4_9BACT|nr:UDP-4-amino-4,6-dideoxy-N-acetyl-beta-L-altrosamine transaminase [Prosthecobacter fusiformis]TDU70673.1 UDP-4-amino-4,6-dideoxy-N-acetyl-beta-L-altrosamine transaminase [Prosthecobacter fusiformis]
MASDFLPYGRQSLDEADIAAVVDVLRSDFLTQGPAIPRFEKAVADWCGARHGIALSNGTATLHCAAQAMGLGKGDWLWTSPITFVASSNAGRYCGAQVDFVDVDPATVCLCPDRLEAKLQQAEKQGRLPKIVVPVHFAGQSCDMPRIHALSQKYGFRILEDAAHALGGSYEGERIGNCRWSDAVSHSFHPVKIVTSAEGGMITTNDEELAWRIGALRTHGITRESSRMQGESDGPWYYQQIELGYNYRMTDLQAALGASQMEKLDRFAQRRQELAELYDRTLAGLPLRPLARDPRGISGWHLYMIRLDLEAIAPLTRRQVFESLRAQNIGVNVHYIPVHLQPDYRQFGFQKGDFPEAERYYEECITLPMFPAMTDLDVMRVKEALCQALHAAA